MYSAENYYNIHCEKYFTSVSNVLVIYRLYNINGRYIIKTVFKVKKYFFFYI